MASLPAVKPKQLALATLMATVLVSGVAAAPAMADVESSDTIETFAAPGPLTAEQKDVVFADTTRLGNPEVTDVITSGQTGSHVRLLQRALNASEHRVPVTGDGIFGPETEAAIRKVQADHGGLVDGIAGSQTVSFITDAIDSDGDGVPDSRE